MNKINKFNIIIGILVIVICIFIAIMAFKAAVLRNQNADNIIYVDSGVGSLLTIPKSNLISQYVNIQKDISGENGVLHIDVKLPKININTDVVDEINEKIYAIYQELYSYAMTIQRDESIDINYTYEYIDKEHKLIINIEENKTANDGTTKTTKTFMYDAQNNKEIKENN